MTWEQLDFDKFSSKKLIFAGVSSGGGIPDPIPNSEVKSASGDGIAGVTLWESSTMPAFIFSPVDFYQLGFFLPNLNYD